jgi:pyrimidine operon attenuation protein/uracil phosphoribosyltransferase
MAVEIMDARQAQQSFRRMAFEIREQNYNAQRLVLAGIWERGYHCAEAIAGALRPLLPVELGHDAMQCFSLPKDAKMSDALSDAVRGAHVVLVDDVLFTGVTLFEALRAVADCEPARVQTALLINRGHRLLPIRADYVGLELASTAADYVRVEMDALGQVRAAWLDTHKLAG